MKKLYSEYRKWPFYFSPKGDGVLVGADSTQEWLLPWWWNHYSRHNHYPVAWVDLGLSPTMKEWCQDKGSLIALPVANIFVTELEEIPSDRIKEWQEIFGKSVLRGRQAWFKKPLAMLRTPFARTVWIDADCEVRGSIEPLFSYAEHPSGLAMLPESHHWNRLGKIFNSGVVVFRWGLPCFKEWADVAIEQNEHHMGDQDALSAILDHRRISIAHLPSRYNFSRMLHDDGQAVILHWHGPPGKKAIESQLIQERLKALISEEPV